MLLTLCAIGATLLARINHIGSKIMTQRETVNKILDVASILFAEQGFSETSLRTITTEAKVNLAAVNYHFGTKKGLIQALFSKFIKPFCAALEEQLDLLELKQKKGSAMELEPLISILFIALNNSMESIGESPQRFMRMVGSAFAQLQDDLPEYFHYQSYRTYNRFMRTIRAVKPDMQPRDLYWRLHFMLGASIFTLSSFERFREDLLTQYDVAMNMQDTVKILIPSMMGIIEADYAHT